MLNHRAMAVMFWVWAGIPAAVPAQTPPEHIEAYVCIVKAEQEERKGRPEAALDLYLKSRDLYQDVARLYPEWQPELVRYRLVAVQNQIERLQRAAGEPKTPGVKSVETNVVPTIPAGGDQGSDRFHEWEQEKAALEMALDDLESERTNLLARVLFLEDALAASKAAGQEAARQWESGQSALGRQSQDLEAENKQLILAMETAQAENQELILEIEQLKEMIAFAGKDLQSAAEQAELAGRKHEEAYAALLKERDLLAAQIGPLEEQARQSKDVPAIRAQYERLQEWVRSATEVMAGLSNDVVRLRVEESASREAAAKTQKSGEAERVRLMAENKALKVSVDEQKAEVDKVRELKNTIRQLEKDKRELERQSAGLNRALDKMSRNDETNTLRNQNKVLQEELNVFRLNYFNADKRIKELERELTRRQAGDVPP